MYVESWGKEHIGTILECLISNGFSDLLNEFLVPGAGKQGSDREVGAIVGVFIPFACRVDTESGRTVRKHNGRNSETWDGVG